MRVAWVPFPAPGAATSSTRIRALWPRPGSAVALGRGRGLVRGDRHEVEDVHEAADLEQPGDARRRAAHLQALARGGGFAVELDEHSQPTRVDELEAAEV